MKAIQIYWSTSKYLIYTFQGLSTNRYGICLDYSPDLSLSDVLSQLTRNVMLQYGNLDMLYSVFIHHNECFTRDHEFPSWVPDWRNHKFRDYSHKVRAGVQLWEISFSFLLDEQGRKGRVLQAYGLQHGILQCFLKERTHEYNTHERYLAFMADIGRVKVWGKAEVGDEIWVMHGSHYPYLFRQHGLYRKLVGQVEYQDSLEGDSMFRDCCTDATHRLTSKVHGLLDESPCMLETIRIC